MGRISSTTQSTGASKAVVVTPTTTALTTVYTNTSGVGAELKAVNISGQQNNTTLNTVASGASEWSFFGANINTLIGAQSEGSYGFGEPYPVQLSDNRVLIFFLPHFQHRGGDSDFFSGTMIHTQILEYQTAGGSKYVAGPIQNHTLPGTMFQDTSYSLWSAPESIYGSGTMGERCWQAVALTSTKVAAAVRIRGQFWLMRFTITGNTVDHTVTSLDLTVAAAMNSSTAYPFAMETVPGNTNQVIIAAADASNWTVQSHNVPNSGALSISSLKQTLWSHGSYMHSIGMAKMVKTATGTTVPYCFAAPTSTTASNGVVYNYDNAAFTWTIQGTNQSLTGISTNHTGFLGACLSTGTGVSAVICTTTGSGAGDGVVTFYRQLSSAGFSTTRQSLTTQHTTYKAPTERFQWGDERAVFTGHYGMLVSYDSAGTATTLLTNQETTNTSRWRPHWFPFNSRPLYTYYDDQTVQANFNVAYVARTGMTSSINLGAATLTENYLPFGHDYGRGYAWNEQASCWIVTQGGRLYALSTDGVIQGEQRLYDMSQTLNYLQRAREVQVTPTGRILFSSDYALGIHVSTSYSNSASWSSHSQTLYLMVTEPCTTPQLLSSIKLQQAPNNVSGVVSGNMTYFTEQTTATTTTEMAYFFYPYTVNSNMYISWFNGTTWQGAAYSTSISIGSSASYTRGWNVNQRMIQYGPCTVPVPRGTWVIVGSYNYNSQSNHRYSGMSVPYAFGSFGSFSTTSYALDTNATVTEGWGITGSTHMGQRSGVQIAAMYEETNTRVRIWASFNGRMPEFRGIYVSGYGDSNHRWPQIAATKFGYTIAFQNTARTDQTATALVWDTVDTRTPKATVTLSSGSGWFTLNKYNKNQMTVYNTTGVTTTNNTYSIYGLPDDIRFYIALDDNAGNVFYLNNGQSLSPVDIFTGLFRSDVAYQIPNGSSLKVAVDTPNTVQVLLSLLER